MAYFTSDGDAAVRRAAAGGPLAAITISRPARYTLPDLLTIQETVGQSMRGADIPYESAVIVSDNRVEVYVLDLVAASAVTLPDGAVFVQAASFSEDLSGLPTSSTSDGVSQVWGGTVIQVQNNAGAYEDCTVGFGVRHSSGTRGLATAGHCGDTGRIGYIEGTAFAERGAQEGGSYDIEWRTASGVTFRGLVYDWGSAAFLPVRDQQNRQYQSTGTYVCKSGYFTGTTCGYIQTTYFDKNQTGFPDQTWVLVRNGSQTLGIKGDSGAPVFTTSGYPSAPFATAYGILSARRSNTFGGWDLIYMPIDFLSGLGLSLVTE